MSEKYKENSNKKKSDKEKKDESKDDNDNDENDEEDDEENKQYIGGAIKEAFNSIFWLVSLLFWASIYIAAFEDLSVPLCETKGTYNSKVPCNMWLRHRVDAEPYMIERNTFQELKHKVTYPVKMALAYSKLYEEEPNPNINWFFRKTYDPIGDYTADVLIESWSWNRELFYKIIVAFAGIYGLKDRIDSKEKHTTNSFKDAISNVLQYVVGYAWINIVPMTISIITFTAPISGIVGLATKAISANFIVRSFFFYTLLAWVLPAIAVYFIQYFHNQGLIYYSAYKEKTSKYGPIATFVYLVKRYRLLVYLNLIISGISITLKGRHNAGLGILLVLLPIFIVKHILTDSDSKAPSWMFSNSFLQFFAGLYEYNNSDHCRKHDSYNIFNWNVRPEYPQTKSTDSRETIIAKCIFGFGILEKLTSGLIDYSHEEKCKDSSDILKTFLKR